MVKLEGDECLIDLANDIKIGTESKAEWGKILDINSRYKIKMD